MSKNVSKSNKSILQKLEGELRFRLTNAYLFVAVLQKDQESLCSLIAALLHIRREDILSVEILNPIVLGQNIDFKDCVLDLLVLLNNHIRINLEMQVANEGNWDERSLYYLSGKLTDLPVGADYKQLKPVIQIGILDFNYPKDNTEFYQRYFFMNEKTHKIFSDKASIHVVCLSQMENATPEDHASGLYEWAKIFKATTWKELKELAKNNSVVEGTVVTMAKLSAEERIRQQCERHEKYERDRINAMNYSFEQGHIAGFSEGTALGLNQGLSLFARLIQKLTDEGRSSEISRVSSDSAYRDQLLREFGFIPSESAISNKF